MKDIKSYIIGFLSCACLLLLTGWGQADKAIADAQWKKLTSQIGKYQFAVDGTYLYIIDTETGEMWTRWDNNDYWVRQIEPNEFRNQGWQND